MQNEQDTVSNQKSQQNGQRFTHWIKVGGIAAASALAGGLAAVWIYRKTLHRLQNAGSEAENSNFRILGSGSDNEL